MDETAQERHARRYRHGLLAMRGGVVAAALSVLVMPVGEGQLLVFLAACLGVAWGTWQRRRHCPLRRQQTGDG
jgi:hypothetical protein